jgi:hypothetical protein
MKNRRAWRAKGGRMKNTSKDPPPEIQNPPPQVQTRFGLL